MIDDASLKDLVRQALGESLSRAAAPAAPAAPALVPRSPEEAALAARVAAWMGRPLQPAAAPTPWQAQRDRQGYLDSTPARLGVGRAGTRPRTATVLEFRADHAAARDAVHSELSDEFLEGLGLVAVQTAAATKADFLRRPDLGRRLSEEGAAKVERECPKRPQVQIVVGDGLSAAAIQVNLPRILPLLRSQLEAAHLGLGRPVGIRNARVAVADEVGRRTQAELLCMLVGERPGLKSAESVGAYITYYAGRKLVEAQRSVISNIHDRGIPPEEGARRIVALIVRAMKSHGTGIDLEQA